MTPVKLTIEGLKSVSERQTVDFEKLSKNGIFGIFGKTGSGKSTILDAIVLALYGDVIGKIDNSDFVNIGSERAYVELIFSVKDGGKTTLYRVERIFKFNKARTELKSTAKLWKICEDGEYAIAENSSETNNKIQNEIIGLKKGDFLKCMALPQGDFAAFIKLTPGERLNVIGKLFNLEKYGSALYKKVNEKYNDTENRLNYLQTKIADLQDCSPEKIKIIAEQKEQAEVLLAQLKQEKDLAFSNNEKAKHYKKLKDEEFEKKNKLAQISAYKSIIDQYKQEVQLFDSLLPLSDKIKSVVNAEKQRAELIVKIHGLKEEKSKLEQQLAKLSEELLKKQEREEKKAELMARKELFAEAYKKQNLFNEKNNDIKQLLAEHSRLSAESKQLLDQIKSAYEKRDHYAECEKNIDVQKIITELSTISSNCSLSEFSVDVINVLNDIKGMICGKVDKNTESAVNRLIDREIEFLKTKITSFGEQEEVRSALEKAIAALDQKSEYSKLCQQETKKAELFDKDYKVKQENIVRITEEGKKLREEANALAQDINNITLGLNLSDAERETDRQLKALVGLIAEVEEKNQKLGNCLAANERELTLREGELHETEKFLSENADKLICDLNALSLDKERAVRIIGDAQNIESKRKKIAQDQKERGFCEKRLEEISAEIEPLSEYADFGKYALLLEESEKKYEDCNKNYIQISISYENGLKKSEDWCIMNKEISESSAKLKLYASLTELVKGGRFMEFIADEYLRDIAQEAEARVLELTGGRYGLVYDKVFSVTDNLKGGAKRPVAGLSGGETFLVSLSLALALASQIGRKALKPIEFFFLDEGFGTLDDELIDAVTNSLEKLQKSDFTVGLITHVTELKNRIQSKLYVTGADINHGTKFTESC